jgi:DNA-binding PadR family transcriptional regulator
MYELTAFQRDLLYITAGLVEPHGLGIKEEIEDYYDKEVNHGRLYPNLDDLVEMGLIEKTDHDDRTNCYQLTTKGEETINSRNKWAQNKTNTSTEVTMTASGD